MSAFSTIRPAYLPDLEYFWYLSQCDSIIFADHLQYSKRSSISISAPLNHKGARLRIPVRHKPLMQPIHEKETDVADNWRDRHIKTMKHTYGHLPYAYHYIPRLEEVYSSFHSGLSDILFQLTSQCLAWLHLEADIHRSGKHQKFDDPHDYIRYWYLHLDKAVYLISEEAFTNEWLDATSLRARDIPYAFFSSFPSYHIMQTYRRLSILNFLMQFGPEAGYIIRHYR